LLARPKDDFVSAFVGQDHTLKRLLLVRAGDAATTPSTARPDLPLEQQGHAAYELGMDYLKAGLLDRPRKPSTA